ncbi:MAG: GNAT family N-acetyltransferase [Clostridium sp.]|nr:GNAT family N-acetyltransferase [Clostridium sp.]
MDYDIQEMKPENWEAVAKIYMEGINTGKAYRGKGVGKNILNNLIKLSEENGIWSLYSAIISENSSSIALHKSYGFREIGVREKVAKMPNGIWHDTVLMERRSKVVGIE